VKAAVNLQLAESTFSNSIKLTAVQHTGKISLGRQMHLQVA
jgi:hypothetical protein